MSDNVKNNNILGYECRFATYCPPNYSSPSDLHVVKEQVRFKDGTSKPNLRILRDYKRSFYIAKKGHQNHKDKKEWAPLDTLIKYESTQSDLVRNISTAIGEPWFKGSLRKLNRNPYIYGSDILSTAVVKRMYQDKFPELITPFTVAAFDIENNVLDGSNHITMATLSFGKKVVTAIHKKFVAGQSNVENRLHEMLTQYLGEYVKKRGIEWEVLLVDQEYEVVTECFKRAHKWMPDFVAIWNINWDMPHILAALARGGINPADVFSDPKVPKDYKYFNYVPGPKQKVTASGLVTAIKPPAQWHTVYCPSSFYFIDAMCAYKHIRTGEAEEPSYSLNSILDKHLGIRKLNFEEAKNISGIDWHIFMQEKYPLHYIIYNVFDCVSMEELDEKIEDLRFTLPMFSGCSDFASFKSQPRRNADEMHYFCLKNNHAYGSTSDQMTSPLDNKTLGLEDWIITLPAHLVVDNGLRCIAEDDSIATNIRTHVADLDVTGSYPNGGAVFNVSKETTHKELCAIKGVPEYTQRMQGINLSGSHTNSVEIATNLYGLPTMDVFLKAFENDLLLAA